MERTGPETDDTPNRQGRGLLLAVDRSATMDDGSTVAVREAVAAIVDRLAEDRQVGLLAFNGKVIIPAPLAPVRDGSFLEAVVNQIDPRGEADLSAALERGIEECHAAAEPADLVLLTAGVPTIGLTRPAQLERIARTRNSSVRVFTVALGDRADRATLETIARAGNGTAAAAATADELEAILAGLLGLDS